MPIVPLVVGEADEAMALCEAALDEGVFVQAIRPPTVPDGTSRLRAVATAWPRAMRAHRALDDALLPLNVQAVVPIGIVLGCLAST